MIGGHGFDSRQLHFFIMATKTTEKYGVELEFTRPGYRQTSSSNEINKAFQKSVEKLNKKVDATGRDGGGVEVNNPPFNFDFYRTDSEEFNTFFEYVEKCSAEHKFNGNSDVAGMHVHVDRDVMSFESFKKMITFLQLEEVLNFLKTFTRRKNRTSFYNVETNSGKTGTKCSTFTKEDYDNAGNFKGNNAIVLNTHGRSGTIEFRFFNGTNLKKDIAQAVQFIRAMIFFIKSSKREVKSFKAFLEYVKEYKKTYPDLVKYMIENKILPLTCLKPVKKRILKSIPA